MIPKHNDDQVYHASKLNLYFVKVITELDENSLLDAVNALTSYGKSNTNIDFNGAKCLANNILAYVAQTIKQ